MLMDESENGDVQGQVDLGDAAEGAQVRAQQRPQAFGGVDVSATAGVFAGAVVDHLVLETCFPQEMVDVVGVGVDRGAALQASQQPGAEGLLLQVLADTHPQLAVALNNGYHWQFVAFPVAASPFLQASSACCTVGFDPARTAFPTADDVQFVDFVLPVQGGGLLSQPFPDGHLNQAHPTRPGARSCAQVVGQSQSRRTPQDLIQAQQPMGGAQMRTGKGRASGVAEGDATPRLTAAGQTAIAPQPPPVGCGHLLHLGAATMRAAQSSGPTHLAKERRALLAVQQFDGAGRPACGRLDAWLYRLQRYVPWRRPNQPPSPAATAHALLWSRAQGQTSDLVLQPDAQLLGGLHGPPIAGSSYLPYRRHQCYDAGTAAQHSGTSFTLRLMPYLDAAFVLLSSRYSKW
jgi:hypothetical protein